MRLVYGINSTRSMATVGCSVNGDDEVFYIELKPFEYRSGAAAVASLVRKGDCRKYQKGTAPRELALSG